MLLSRPDPALWTPVRTISYAQRCHFCRAGIARDRPGSRTGERGTKAFFNRALNLWECIACREEATRAELARQAPRESVIEACEACRYERLDIHLPDSAPLFALMPCDGCELGADRGLHRICPRCRHVEHRSHRIAGQLEGAA
jgi:hypothetical protein